MEIQTDADDDEQEWNTYNFPVTIPNCPAPPDLMVIWIKDREIMVKLLTVTKSAINPIE